MPQTQDENSHELKREVGIWGSFSMGYADVGADIYVVLGVIILFAGIASPFAFGIAAIVYVCTGLCYAELATKYPVAGGGQYYSMKAFGKLHGFIAGWGLMLVFQGQFPIQNSICDDHYLLDRRLPTPLRRD